MDNGSYITKTYTYDELVTALNTVQPFDWNTFLRSRVYDVSPQVPEDGITRGGYRIVYNDEVPDWIKHNDSRGANFSRSLGFGVNEEGNIDQVIWDSPAFKSGITPDMQLEAVNDQKYSVTGMREAIVAAERKQNPRQAALKARGRVHYGLARLPQRAAHAASAARRLGPRPPRRHTCTVEVEAAWWVPHPAMLETTNNLT